MLLSYIYFSSIQIINLFMEMQFDHLPYIRDLDREFFNYKNFFTTYGEHITAGYNIILTLNYYFFRISGYFDNYLSIFLNLINFYLVFTYFKMFGKVYYQDKIFVLLLAFTFFSLTNNPMAGMALSAQLGLTFLLAAVYFLKSFFTFHKFSWLFLSLISFLIAIGLCLGGYAVGAISFLLVAFILEVRNRNYRKGLILFAFVALSLTIYLFIFSISNNTVLVNHAKGTFVFNLVDFMNFFLIMIGNSFLGKAFYESTNIIWPYYIIAASIIIWALPFLKKLFSNHDRSDIMILFMTVYPVATIFFTGLFRHNIGGDPLGQWYFRHICFIPIITYIAIANTSRFPYLSYRLTQPLKKFSVSLIIVFLVIGNLSDIKKSPYVADWKAQFYNQVPVIMFNNESIDRSTHFNYMLNDLNKVYEALMYFYENNLWIFRKKDPHIFLNEMANGNLKLQIICPVDTSELLLLDPKKVSGLKLTDGSYLIEENDVFTFVNFDHKKNFYKFELNQDKLKIFQSNIQCR